MKPHFHQEELESSSLICNFDKYCSRLKLKCKLCFSWKDRCMRTILFRLKWVHHNFLHPRIATASNDNANSKWLISLGCRTSRQWSRIRFQSKYYILLQSLIVHVEPKVSKHIMRKNTAVPLSMLKNWDWLLHLYQ